jgi:hypothetical protein
MKKQEIIIQLCLAGLFVFIVALSSYHIQRVKGYAGYGTITSQVADDPSEMKKYDEIAPRVCNLLTSRFKRDLDSLLGADSQVLYSVNYKGSGLYLCEYNLRGRGVHSALHSFMQDEFYRTYEKVVEEEGLDLPPPFVLDGRDQASIESHLTTNVHVWVLVAMATLFFISRRVHVLFSKLDSHLVQREGP